MPVSGAKTGALDAQRIADYAARFLDELRPWASAELIQQRGGDHHDGKRSPITASASSPTTSTPSSLTTSRPTAPPEATALVEEWETIKVLRAL